MPTPEELAPLAAAMTEWRRDLHRHPELGFEERRTATLVAARLRGWGLEVAEGSARTGVVGTLRGAAGPGNRAVALRADMDALAMAEATGLAWASEAPGRMHACGHDGHTATLLGAAAWLAERRERFRGTVHFVFQPAEEALGGARVMVEVAFRGAGTHGAKPHLGTDATVAAAQFVLALQAIAAREIDPMQVGVVSVGHLAAGDAKAPSVIPAEVFLRGTARSFSAAVRDLLGRRIAEIARGVAATYGVAAEPRYQRRLAPTVNHAAQAEVAARAAEAAVGAGRAVRDYPPVTAGEDFSEMLARVPGAYAWLGTGAPAHPEGVHHNPHFDFNDAALAAGAAYWCSLVEAELGA